MKNDKTLKVGDIAVTLGYYEANDDGGAKYKIKLNTEKYGETLNNNLIAELIIRDSIKIKQFGAYGDGEHDDSKFLKLFTSIENVKTLIINNGSYLINNDTFFIKDKNILFDNSELIIGEYLNYENDVININGTCKLDNWKIKVLSNSWAKHVLGFKNSHDCIINNLIINVLKTSLRYEDSFVSPLVLDTNNTDLVFNNCQIIHLANGISGGIWIREGDSNKITKNIYFNNCSFIKQNGDEIIAIWGWKGSVSNVHFNSCFFNQKNMQLANPGPYYFFTAGQSGILDNLVIDSCTFDLDYVCCGIIKTLLTNPKQKVTNIHIENSTFNINYIDTRYQYTHALFGQDDDNRTIHNYTNCYFYLRHSEDAKVPNLFKNSILNNCFIYNINNKCLADYFVNCKVLNSEIEYVPSLTGGKLIEGTMTLINNYVKISANLTEKQRQLIILRKNSINTIENNIFIFDEENSPYGIEIFFNENAPLTFLCNNNYFEGIGFYINNNEAYINFSNNILINTKKPRINLTGKKIFGSYLNNDDLINI